MGLQWTLDGMESLQRETLPTIISYLEAMDHSNYFGNVLRR